MSVSIHLKNVVKKYNETIAIPDLTLDIQEGEFFTLLGPSGCGKTTLLRMIAGFNSIEDGTISFNGEVINDRPPKDRNIGMVFQNYAIFPQMTVAKNVGFGLTTRKVPRAEATSRVAKVLNAVHIAKFKDRLPANMSGGQQQRIALARAIVIEPAVLLMDEPLSNLDAKLRVEMRDVIKDIQHTVGITTVYVTHDQEEAMAVSDRIAVMNNGVVQHLGTPANVYHRPANVFVADFIGKTNLLERTITHDEGGLQLPMDEEYLVDVTDIIDASEMDSDSVTVSIRPESLQIATDGKGMEGSIIDAVFLGSNIHYRARLKNGECVEFIDVSHLDNFLATGSTVRLSIDPSRINLFDATTKQSVTRGVKNDAKAR